MLPKLYLAGPIGDESYEGSTGWREAVKHALHPQIECYSPLRGFTHLKVLQKIGDTVRHDAPRHHTTRAIMSRDHGDVRVADALLVRLHGAKKISTGTVMELAWAFDYHKRTVVWIEDGEENIHAQHPMLSETFKWRTPHLTEAIAICREILLP